MLIDNKLNKAGLLFCASLILLVLTASAQDRPLIVIDPGHGGEEIGVEHGGVLEKDLILEISMIMGAEFVKAGYDVMYTRTKDVAVSWSDRRQIAEDAGAAMLFMLHANRNEDPNRHGAEIYLDVEKAESKRLVDILAESMEEAGSAVLVDPKPWPFLKSESIPTAMVEVAFMTNPVERRLLASTEFHHELGNTFVAAADKFLADQ
jgi:N-acetylmuramoyl-L-alanine amidase